MASQPRKRMSLPILFLLSSSWIIISSESAGNNNPFDGPKYAEKRQFEGQTPGKQMEGNQANHHHHYAVPSFNGLSFPAPPAPASNSQQAATRGPIIMPANNQLQVNNFRNNQQLSQGSPAAPLSRPLPAAAGVSDSELKFAPTSANEDFLHAKIGLALRQAAGGDETNFFHPFSLISSPPDSHQQQQQQHQGPYDWSALSHQQQVKPTTSTTTTTEHSNNIEVGPSHEPTASLVSSVEISANQASQGQEQIATANQEQPPILTLNSNQNSTLELNNQVIYEGPATAPPAGDNYYSFSSSSEKVANADLASKPSNAWWAIGAGPEFDLASNLTINDYLDYCAKSELLVGAKQRALCRAHPKIMPIVARGLKLAIEECQSRFSKSRWNCSLAIQDHSNPAPNENDSPTKGSNNNQAFGELMKQPIREKSYLNAIIGAGLAHAMTKACSQGELPEECSCDKRIKSRNQRNKIEWVACSDDIDYGAKFSRDFTDNTEYDSETSAMINSHNYEVGRRVFKSSTDITCSCQNGENGGLCQTKKCWKHLGSFSDIGDELMKRYESATHVQLSNRDPHKLRPVRRGVRKPKRKDLVYIDESPDYCTQDTRIGVLGTQNRHCNSTSSGPDSCSLLCCGRGYQVVVEEIEEDCNCKFVFCCQVKCNRCKRQVTNDICN